MRSDGAIEPPRKISVLGSTGSVGVSTLDVLSQAGVEVEVAVLAAGRNVELLAEQALRWRPRIAVVGDEAALPRLRALLAGSGIETAAGAQATVDAAAEDAQWVMSAIVGFAGLAPTLAAARAGAIVALANKESLVCAGPELLRAARLAGGMVIPVDPEHSAIFQVLEPRNAARCATDPDLVRWAVPRRDSGAMARRRRSRRWLTPNFAMGAKIRSTWPR